MNMTSGLQILVAGAVTVAGGAISHAAEDAGGAAEPLGTVKFPTSCAAEVQDDFSRAVAMLHSFWYGASENAFMAVSEKDPGCAMAHWGIAMSRFHQLWAHGSRGEIEEARALLGKAAAIEGTSERESDYIDALEAYYLDDDGDSLARMQRYEAAMEALHEKYPDDAEAAIFYALSVLGTAYASAPDPTLARQRYAGAILEKILVAHPNHPGVVHYIIHSYDYPELADRALEAARRYAEIAPAAPHALHMPSHIFTRLGLWEESIATNLKAAEAARRDNWTGEELHATDYLTYAYLQTAQDAKADAIGKALPDQERTLIAGMANHVAGVFAAAAIPARIALERRQWKAAAGLEVDDLVAQGRLCWVGAMRHFARGLGAAQTDDLSLARESAAALEACRHTLAEDGSLWADPVEAQRLAVVARIALAEGRRDDAVTTMRAAADLEDSTDKPPITPGQIVPARELLGDMLLELDRPGEALTEFEVALQDTPNRFRSVYGAAQAAAKAGKADRAKAYYARLIEITRAADSDRQELREAMTAAAR